MGDVGWLSYFVGVSYFYEKIVGGFVGFMLFVGMMGVFLINYFVVLFGNINFFINLFNLLGGFGGMMWINVYSIYGEFKYKVIDVLLIMFGVWYSYEKK